MEVGPVHGRLDDQPRYLGRCLKSRNFARLHERRNLVRSSLRAYTFVETG